ncbi:hypothetical protein, conserved [Leishmania tarentolae]|uniref:Uncharacterized protein n=1 Tax=Leishmania tarentolae TaxID=5689 RepID=A0A640KID4_LEITA|nr:hypothetical protein, conserved [Leishmania tarentolae]
MASSSPSPCRHSTSTRDYLFRSLYLRREMLLLTTHSIVPALTPVAEGKYEGQPNVTNSAEPTASTLQDVLLLPPLYGLEGVSLIPSLSEEPTLALDPMLTLDHAWNGLVHVRSSSSPWYRGCFAFYVYFPSRYPFEPPIIELTGPLRSHPLVQERCLQHLHQLNGAADHLSGTSSFAHGDCLARNASSVTPSEPAKRFFVPFEEVYSTMDPMRVSVMSALMRHMQLVFLPAEWPPSWRLSWSETNHESGTVNLALARRDVERRSVTQEVLLLKPFEQYLGTEVMEHFLNVWKASEDGAGDDMKDAVTGDNADWYTREVLPHLLHS